MLDEKKSACSLMLFLILHISKVQGEYLLVKINSNELNVERTNGNPKEDILPIPNEITLRNPRNFNQQHTNLGAPVMPRVVNNQRYVPDVPKRLHQIKINHPSPAIYGKASSNHVISSARPLVGHRRRSGLRGGVKSKGNGYRQWIPFIPGRRVQPIPGPRPTPPPMYQPGLDVDIIVIDPDYPVGHPDYEYKDNFEEDYFEEDNFDEDNFGFFEDDEKASYLSDDRYPLSY